MQQCPLLPLPACRYPLIVKDVIEEEPRDNGDGEEVPVNTAEPNPNGVELDNLYLVSLSLHMLDLLGTGCMLQALHAQGSTSPFWECSPAGGCCHLYVASHIGPQFLEPGQAPKE